MPSPASSCPDRRKHASPASSGPGRLRITGGSWRSRRLAIAPVEGLRPTPDRAREMLCNWLTGHFEGARCLDAFAGTGALGFEALSRGAAHTTFLDASSLACQTLQTNLQTLGCTQAEVIRTDALTWTGRYEGAPFDLIFLDPPFGQGLIASVCEQLQHSRCLARNTTVYIETEPDLSTDCVPEHWTLWKEKAVGKVVCRLYRTH